MESSSAYSPYRTNETSGANNTDTQMMSGMVAEEVRRLLSDVTMQIRPNNDNDFPPSIFSGKVYNPRLQKEEGREQWREDIYESMRRAKIPAAELTTAPPTYEQIKQRDPTFDDDQLELAFQLALNRCCLLYTSPSPRDS